MNRFDSLSHEFAGRCNPAVLDELAEARIPAFDVDFTGRIFPDVRATKIGVLNFACGIISVFTRAGTYWRVKMSKPLPYKVAHALNELAGDVVRAYGMSGGSEVRPSGCDHWHVDAQEGLILLATTLRIRFGELVLGRFPKTGDLVKLGLLDGQVYK